MMFFIYMLECRDLTYYTGWTTEVSRRLQAHRAGKGARYTRGRLPVKLVYAERCASQRAAQQREYAVKHLSRKDKAALAAGWDGDYGGKDEENEQER
jgi:putative endonuclease